MICSAEAHSVILMICAWTVQYHLGLLFMEVMMCSADVRAFSTEEHSVILMICTWIVQYHLGLQILLFVVCGTDDIQWQRSINQPLREDE